MSFVGTEFENIRITDNSLGFMLDGVTQWSIDNTGRLIPASISCAVSANLSQSLEIYAGSVTVSTVSNPGYAGNVGLLALTGGIGGDGDAHSGEGGDIALIAGRSGRARSGTAGEGGSIQLTTGAGGTGYTGGAAGSIELITNNGGDGTQTLGGAGGNLNITLGDGGDSGEHSGLSGAIGGCLVINAGDGGSGDSRGPGGSISLIAGEGQVGGKVLLVGGKGSGTGGDVEIKGGFSHTNPVGGNIILQSGTNDNGCGIIDLRVTSSNDTADYLRLEQDNTGYWGTSTRLRLPQSPSGRQSITGTVTTIEANPHTNVAAQSAGQVLSVYVASTTAVSAVKLLICISHDTLGDSSSTEIAEYLLARTSDNQVRFTTLGYVNSDVSRDSSQYSQFSASVNADGIIEATITAVYGNDIRINIQATEFKTSAF